MEVQTFVSNEAMIAQHKSEIDMQISTAKAYPRTVIKAMDESKAMISISPEIAAGCFYSLTKGGNIITGPSIRLAEILMSSWGNCNVGGRVIEESEEWVTVQGVAHDLETNVRFTSEIRRRITKKDGKRYSTDVIQSTIGAAIAIGIRNAIFKIVPTSIINELDRFAREKALGKIDKHKQLIDQWVEYYLNTYSVSSDLLCLKVGANSVDEITRPQLQILVGIGTALRDEQTTVEKEFNDLIPEPQAMNTENQNPPPEKSVESQVMEELGND